MGKLNKLLNKKDKGVLKRIPLLQQLSTEVSLSNKTRFLGNEKLENQKYLDSKLSSKIIIQAKQQLEELNEDLKAPKHKDASSELNLLNDDIELCIENLDSQYLCDKDIYYEDNELSKEDSNAFDKFMNADINMRQSMADLISERLTEKKTELNSQILGDLEVDPVSQLDPKIVELYRGVGKILSQYRSGKLPKAFKIIPALADWESILQLTNPDKWTAAAMYQATRLFASNLNTKLAQRFYNKILLPRIRDDIAEYKKLNFHLYQAVYKSMFKPAAFFKGILIPLCSLEQFPEGSNLGGGEDPQHTACSLREALIIGGIVHKNSVPMLHSCAAMLKLVEMCGTARYSSPVSVFLRILLSKNYALPGRVLESLMTYFTGFRSVVDILPVLWHQSLLTFVQNYKSQMTVEQREDLLELCKRQFHDKITPVIRDELNNVGGGDKEADKSGTVDEDITME